VSFPLEGNESKDIEKGNRIKNVPILAYASRGNENAEEKVKIELIVANSVAGDFGGNLMISGQLKEEILCRWTRKDGTI
jgi:hypothetical protein